MALLRIGALLCPVVFLAVPIAAQKPASSAPTVVVKELTVDDPGHATIPVVIWSPSTGSALPLVVISHGAGAEPFAHVDTAQALTQSGFVVVAPMHPGDNFQDESVVGKPAWFVDRTRNIRKVIDYMFTQWDGRTRLVPDHVGVFGFSAGATTALLSVGGVPDLDRVQAQCAQKREFVCKLMAQPSSPDAKSDSRQWVRDRRIAAAVVVAPALGFAFEPAGLANVKVPVQLWSGEADQTVPYETNAALVRKQLSPSVDFHSVPGAIHLSFLAPCGPDSPPVICKDGEGFDRSAFHKEFNRSVTEFFRKNLTSRTR